MDVFRTLIAALWVVGVTIVGVFVVGEATEPETRAVSGTVNGPCVELERAQPRVHAPDGTVLGTGTMQPPVEHRAGGPCWAIFTATGMPRLESYRVRVGEVEATLTASEAYDLDPIN